MSSSLRAQGRKPFAFFLCLGVLIAVGVAPTAQAGASTGTHRIPTAAQAVRSAQPAQPAQARTKQAPNAAPRAAAKRPTHARSATTPSATFPSSLDALRGHAFGTSPFEADISCAAPGGLWSSPSTWTGGVVPTGADNVTISSGCTVTIDTAAAALNLSIDDTLQYEDTTARTLTVGADVAVAPAGIFRSAATGSVTAHSLSVGGNLTNHGTIDFSTNADTAGAQIIFTGAANATLMNLGALDVRQTTGITLNKGTSAASTLDFSPVVGGTLTVQGANTSGFLAITNGTFKISNSDTFSNPLFAAAAYTIPATGGLWLNNPNATIVGQNGSPTNNGSLRLTTGTFNVGTLGTNVMGAGVGASFNIEGGTANFAGRLNSTNTFISYTQSGGAVNICVAGGCATTPSFGFTGITGVVTKMSGGSINLVNSNGLTTADYNQSGTMVYTGGTLNIGTAATATNFSFRAQGQTPNVVIDNTTNNKTLLASGQLNVWGNLTINSGTTFNTQANTLLQIGPTITNNGAIVTTTNNTGSVNFGGTQQTVGGGYAQTYTGSGTFGTPALRPASFAVQNAPGVTIDPGVSPLYVNRINAFYGAITNANKIAVGNGDAIALVIQRGATGIPFAAGSLDVAPTFNIGSLGLTEVYSQSQTPLTTGPEIPATRTVASIQVFNPTGTTLAGGPLTATNAASALILGAGTLTTSASNLLTLTGTAVGAVSGGSAATWVNGPLERTLPASLATAATYTLDRKSVV